MTTRSCLLLIACLLAAVSAHAEPTQAGAFVDLFNGNAEANKLLRRKYREGFEVKGL